MYGLDDMPALADIEAAAAEYNRAADLGAIRVIFKQHGLGPVPMKSSAPSLKVKRAPALTAPVESETLTAVAPGTGLCLDPPPSP
ncbi:hypothetical protein [Saccharothrix sp. ST-888]|uniref:hypothetical protein n=1 Tax=Saccharothrix sp. ST-888 TaxID=1427391 RepID=UPI0005EC5FE3|nr:hypothetical protein [Saccharothrix sp. ST-888]KJK59052.1 hypothetical protein UK12_06555 [Saccharothrix sp. ST-888]